MSNSSRVGRSLIPDKRIPGCVEVPRRQGNATFSYLYAPYEPRDTAGDEELLREWAGRAADPGLCVATWAEQGQCSVSGPIGVPGARLYVEDLAGQVCQEALLNDLGTVTLLLESPSSIRYWFDEDPVGLFFYPDQQPRDPGWSEWWDSWDAPTLDEFAELLEAFGTDIVWGALKGDFEDDPAMGAIVLRTLLTLIPVVDQIADIQDLAANLKKLVWDDPAGYDDWEVWLALVLTGLGLIPTVGSALKGVGKILWKLLRDVNLGNAAGVFKKVLAHLNTVGRGNWVQWLKELPAKIDDYFAVVRTKLGEILTQVQYVLRELKKRLTAELYPVLRKVLSNVDEALARLSTKVDETAAWFRERIEAITGNRTRTKLDGDADGTNVHVQKKDRDASVDEVEKPPKDPPLNADLIAGMVGKSGSEVFGRAEFRGLIKNRKLKDLSGSELYNALQGLPYRAGKGGGNSHHIIKRLKDSRTRELGMHTLNDFARLLNNGVIEEANRGCVQIVYGSLRAIVNPVSKTLVTLSPL